MDKHFLYQQLRTYNLAVIATLTADNKPEAALVGIAISENLEIIFDTVRQSRKYKNLLHNPRVAAVIGWDLETTLQYEGVASELTGKDSNALKEIYFSVYPDGRERDKTWPGLVHFIIRPEWIRYSNFNGPPVIEEMKF